MPERRTTLSLARVWVLGAAALAVGCGTPASQPADAAPGDHPDDLDAPAAGGADGADAAGGQSGTDGGAGAGVAGDGGGAGAAGADAGGPTCLGRLFLEGVPRAAAGRGPHTVAAADLNGDGKLDLVTNNISINFPSDVTVMIGRGDGTFAPPVSYGPDANAAFVVIADFDGDHHPDLAIPYTYGDAIGFLRGNGDGSFQAPVNSPKVLQPGQNGAGDFNGDGKLDLVVGYGAATKQLGFLRGHGDGTFDRCRGGAARG